MPPKTGKGAISHYLEYLDDKQLKTFRSKLADRREEPRIPRGRLQHADHLDLADLMVGAFTETPAVRIAIELLTEMDCKDVAEDLKTFLSTVEPSHGASGVREEKPSNGASGCGEKHFVDVHRLELTRRVTLLPPILDGLLDEGVITQAAYDMVMAKDTPQDRMRALYNGPLLSSGTKGKDIFFKILKENNKFLVKELMGE